MILTYQSFQTLVMVMVIQDEDNIEHGRVVGA
jgi:hypothetical protein